MSASKIVLKVLSICFSALIFLLLVFVIFRLGIASYDMGYRVFTEKPMEQEPGKDVVLQVTDSSAALSIGTALEEKGLIDNAFLFMVQLKLSAYSNKIKPGLYTLNTSQTVTEMLKIMSAEKEPEEPENDDKDS